MSKTYKTPGVYVEETTSIPPTIDAVQTAIPAFIGYTQKARRGALSLVNKPMRISSLVEYEGLFGKAQNEINFSVTVTDSQTNDLNFSTSVIAHLDDSLRSRYIMYYSLQLFFANGGGACYIVSVGPYVPFTSGKPAEPVVSELIAGLDCLVNVDEPLLLVFPESQRLGIADYQTLHDKALIQCADLRNRFTLLDMHGGDQNMNLGSVDLTRALTNFRLTGIGMQNLAYGAAYAPNLITTIKMAYDESKIEVNRRASRASATVVKLKSLSRSNRTMYERCKAALRDFPCVLPPSGAIAGVYAATDSSQGVWKSPANVTLTGVVGPTVSIGDVGHQLMNIDSISGKSVNAIRLFSDRGTLVWGGRTLAGNDNEWRYINVRRFFSFVEDSIQRATALFVFESNGPVAWLGVKAMIENFLTGLWRQGALQGTKPEHAFRVVVGLGETMTPQDVLEGRMIIVIGMATMRPAEFTILTLTLKMAEI